MPSLPENWGPGSVIGKRFRIVARLGAGGMGEVFQARDTVLGRDVAVKTLPPGVSQDNWVHARLEREARAASALNHPNIVSVYDFGQEDGTSYIVSEWLDGESLGDLIGRGRVPTRKLIEIGVQIAEGLAAAQSAGIIHRDLKPSNVMLTRAGRVKIIDFGLAKETHVRAPSPDTGATESMTTPGVVMGTIGYMSPEQVRGGAVDARSDIFNLGIILYEMFSGKRPFTGDSSVEVMHAILKQEPPEPAAGMPAALNSIIRRCLEKDPGRRFQSAADLAFALQSAGASSAGAPAPPARPSKTAIWVAVSALLVCLTAALTYWAASRKQSIPAPSQTTAARAPDSLPVPRTEPKPSAPAPAKRGAPSAPAPQTASASGAADAKDYSPAAPSRRAQPKTPPPIETSGIAPAGDKPIPWLGVGNRDSSQYRGDFDKFVKQGFRPVFVTGYNRDGSPLYFAGFEKDPSAPPWFSRHSMSPGDYQREVTRLRGMGYRLVFVNAYTVDDQPVFSAIWEQTTNDVRWGARHGLSSEELRRELVEYSAQGFHPAIVTGYADHGQTRYAAIWVKSVDSDQWVARYGLSAADYHREFNEWKAQGYRPAYISVWSVGGQPYFAAVWKKTPNPPEWVEFSERSWEQFGSFRARYVNLGYRPIENLGYLDRGEPRFAGIWAKIRSHDQW